MERKAKRQITQRDLDILVAEDILKSSASTEKLLCFCRKCGAHEEENFLYTQELIKTLSLLGVKIKMPTVNPRTIKNFFIVTGNCKSCRLKDEPLTVVIRKFRS